MFNRILVPTYHFIKTLADSHLQNKNIKNVFRQAFYLFSGDGLSFVAVFFSHVILTRCLGAEKYGLMALVIATVTIVYQFFDFRVREAIVKFYVEFKADGQKHRALAIVKLCYLVTFLTGIIAFLAIVLLSDVIVNYLVKVSSAKKLIIIFAFTTLGITLSGASMGIFQAVNKFSLIAKTNSLRAMMSFAAVFVLIFLLDKDLYELFIANAFISFSIMLIVTYLSLKHLRKDLEIAIDSFNIRGMWQELRGEKNRIFHLFRHSYLNAFFKIFKGQMDIIILGYLSTQSQIGYYKLAKTVASITGVLSRPISEVMYVEVFKIRNKPKRTQSIKSYILTQSSLTLVTMIGFLLVGKKLIALCFGNEFSVAFYPAAVLLLANSIFPIFVWAKSILVDSGKYHIQTYLTAITTVLNIFLLFILISKFGIVGASVTFLIVALINNIYKVMYLWKRGYIYLAEIS